MHPMQQEHNVTWALSLLAAGVKMEHIYMGQEQRHWLTTHAVDAAAFLNGPQHIWHRRLQVFIWAPQVAS